MRLTLTIGGNTVDLRTDPAEGVSLRAAEQAALRLLKVFPSAANADDDQPFGFTLSSDNERAPEIAAGEAEGDE